MSLTEIILACGAMLATTIVVWFNLKTGKLVRLIQLAALKHGSDWPFWSDRQLRLNFVLAPAKLLQESDAQDVQDAKRDLIRHRERAMLFLCFAVLILLGSAVFAVIVPLVIALLDGRYGH